MQHPPLDIGQLLEAGGSWQDSRDQASREHPFGPRGKANVKVSTVRMRVSGRGTLSRHSVLERGGGKMKPAKKPLSFQDGMSTGLEQCQDVEAAARGSGNGSPLSEYMPFKRISGWRNTNREGGRFTRFGGGRRHAGLPG